MNVFSNSSSFMPTTFHNSFVILSCPIILILISFTFISCSQDISSNKDLNNLSIEEIYSKCGRPNSQSEFVLSENPLEYRRSLLSKFDFKVNDSITIVEALWIEGNLKTVVWFDKVSGKSIDNLKWNVDKINF